MIRISYETKIRKTGPGGPDYGPTEIHRKKYTEVDNRSIGDQSRQIRLDSGGNEEGPEARLFVTEGQTFSPDR